MSIRATYAWQLLRAGPLKLDGGSMFGVVPKVLWSRNVSCDDQGRIELAHNCLLLTPPLPNTAGPRCILIEVGSGDKFDEKNRKIFGLSDRSIITALADITCRCEEIDHVIVTHLHFDHAGGLTRLASGGIAPTFPNATIHVQQREWDDCIANRSVMTRTYLPENREGIGARLRLHHAHQPFSPGHLPQRDEFPVMPFDDREIEILPGIFVFLVPGHTWGQQAVRFTDTSGRTIVFTPDILPTIHHVGAAYNMAYDVEPYMNTVNRRWFLQEAAQRDWVLVLDHEPGNPCYRVQPDRKGWFTLTPLEYE